MNRWLLKTEPSQYSFADLVRERRTTWDGVSNPLALKHLRAIQRGDLVFVYHTGDEKAVIGIARAVADAKVDPRNARLAVVDLEPDQALARPVTLAEIKADPAFADFALVRLSRLSVMPVPEPVWRRLLQRGAQPADQTAAKRGKR